MKALVDRSDRTCFNYRMLVRDEFLHGDCDELADFRQSVEACASPTSSHSDSLYWLAVVSLGAR